MNASCAHICFILPENAYLSSTDTEFDLSVLLEEWKAEEAVKHTPLQLLIKPLPVVLITLNGVWDQKRFFYNVLSPGLKA